MIVTPIPRINAQTENNCPQQDFSDAAARTFDSHVDATVFDPWSALMEHRPLGDVMRARKVVYFASERTRGAR